jgi:hypothetical protein
MQYVVVLKSFEGASQGLDVKGQLKFYRFNFTLDNVANIVLNSMGKSIRCIEMPQQMIEEFTAGNSDFDYNSTLPSQENLPSVEELESQFVNTLEDMLSELGIMNPADVAQIMDILDWANNDKILSAQDVFADAQASVEFYNSLTNPEMKKKALMNSRGYLQTLQFDLNRGQVLDIESLAGQYTTLPSGQSSVDIGTIMIGAEYVQEVLNRMTEELNQSIFTIFQSVKAIQEGTYAFMAGGLRDDNQAEKAINASRDVEAKTQELRAGEADTNLDL